MAKFKNWNQIPVEKQEELAALRLKEKEWKSKSNLHKFYAVFCSSSIVYASFLYRFVHIQRPEKFVLYLTPLVPLAFSLHWLIVDVAAFKTYFDYHKEINRQLNTIKMKIRES